MSDELEKFGKNLLNNYVNLLQGRFISHAIGAIGSFLVIRILQPQLYGELSIAMSFVYLLNIVGNLGVNTAVTKFVAKYKVERIENAYKVISSGMLFDIIFGASLSLIAYFISPLFLLYVYNKPEVIPYAKFASLYLIFYWSFSSVFSGLLGLELTKDNSKLWIIHYSSQTFFSISLALIWDKIYGVILGYALGYGAATIYGVFLLIKHRVLNRTTLPSLLFIKEMIKFGLPLIVPSILSNVGGAYTNSIINRFLSIIELSNINATSKIGYVFDTILNPLSYAIQPILAKIDYSQRERMVNVINELTKVNSISQIPLVFFVIGFSYSIIDIIAGPSYTLAPRYLQFSMISPIITTLVGFPILNSVILFRGDSKTVSKISSINTVFYAILLSVLIPLLGPLGYFLSSWISWIPGYIVALINVKSLYPNYKFPIGTISRIYLIPSLLFLPFVFIPVHLPYLIVVGLGLLFINYKLYYKIGLISKGEAKLLITSIDNSGLRVISPLVKFILS
ncbi:oligosaccharide flippase family protein [Stygiolobus caldivivus]|uniref:Polysaccharide biosynthesis protein n=1 Tax=Stygiolobus caldivivus TaxID=2824673 RepID=A0A8D5ZGR2_9CREN|nr:oligosaccharide flippase family protein [Stygiolobus caldivivus]BCU69059.1 hypothetical protein KN1_03560 [Stygiolobus caldivivus]